MFNPRDLVKCLCNSPYHAAAGCGYNCTIIKALVDEYSVNARLKVNKTYTVEKTQGGKLQLKDIGAGIFHSSRFVLAVKKKCFASSSIP